MYKIVRTQCHVCDICVAVCLIGMVVHVAECQNYRLHTAKVSSGYSFLESQSLVEQDEKLSSQVIMRLKRSERSCVI